ncbi:function [Seminavis robusta]|uniref:Function n=1 Tax=Seminavis robusta TaxID=568900 RepID=A0A9N8DCC4_9STRA|nr:function [Seminavis robusta]|eukprot:Sro82_g044120.1 function (242) ;mRNA; f:123785-124510
MGQCLSIFIELLKAAQEEEQQQQQQQTHHQEPPSTAETSSSPNAAATYPSLPADAEQHRVRNVYDGDTLTLTDERRVRFLGIDTPEIKEKQPFAQEAKAYSKDLCDKKDIWISFDGDNKQDHYGRLLAFVWVPAPENNNGNSYLCVNEGLVAHGFASAYTPNNKQAKLHNWDKLVRLQSNARTQKRGMWSNFQDDSVYKTANGAAYHRRDCQHLTKVKHVEELATSQAMDRGLHACRTCMG